MSAIGEYAAFADQLSRTIVQRKCVVRRALLLAGGDDQRLGALADRTAASSTVDETFADLDRAVEELRVQNEALVTARVEVEESTAVYRDLFERAPFPYVVTTTATQITYANDAACRFLGRSKNALVRKPLACFVPLGERDRFREAVLRCCVNTRAASWPVAFVPTEAPRPVQCRVQVGLVEGRTPGAPPALFWNIAEETDEDLF